MKLEWGGSESWPACACGEERVEHEQEIEEIVVVVVEVVVRWECCVLVAVFWCGKRGQDLHHDGTFSSNL